MFSESHELKLILKMSLKFTTNFSAIEKQVFMIVYCSTEDFGLSPKSFKHLLVFSNPTSGSQ